MTPTNRSQSKTRDHSSASTRRGSRPSSQSTGSTGNDSSASADEIRETVKEAVGKGVAAVAGAVEGIDETMQETQLADTAESAIHQVGQTATKVVSAAKEEATNLKEAFTGEGGGQSSDDEDAQLERDDPTFSHGSGLAGASSGSMAPLGSGFESSSYNTEAASDGEQLSSELDAPPGSLRSSRTLGADLDEDEDSNPHM